MNSNRNFGHFKEITDQSLIGFILFDTKGGHSIYSNAMAQQILEQTTDGPLLLTDLVAEASRRDLKFRPFNLELIQHEGLFQNIIVKKKTGSSFVASCGVRSIEIEGEVYTLLMLQDTTLQAKLQREVENKQNEIRVAYEELLVQNRQLKELDIAKNRFIALVTHELRTPASAVVATAETLKLGLYDTQEELKTFLNMIFDEGRHLLELVNDILDFAKIQAGKMEYYIEEADLGPLIAKVTETLMPVAQKSGIELKCRTPKNPVKCYFDSLRMKQILTNLISNGIKYNREKGHVEVFVENVENLVRVHIKDSGQGISEKNKKLIFNEFETLGKISSHSKGTGLGLPIAKKMIESMGGTIGLESVEGQGSDFWIDVPVNKVLGESEHYRSRSEDGIEDLAA